MKKELARTITNKIKQYQGNCDKMKEMSKKETTNQKIQMKLTK